MDRISDPSTEEKQNADFKTTLNGEDMTRDCANPPPPKQPTTPKLRAYTIGDFLALKLEPREMILAPIIPQQGLAMIYSWRGVGKTHVALDIAYAVAGGGKFLKWRAPKARPTLYIDGEMPAGTMQDRLAAIEMASDTKAAEVAFHIITPDLQDLGFMPNLTTQEDQQEVDRLIEDKRIKFVVIDNIATLCGGGGKENEAESWRDMQGWLLKLRRKGVSVLLVHHAGKGGAQRGTSSREDVLDTSISLVRPSDYQPADGCRFEVYYEKARGLFGPEAEPFEAQLEVRDGAARWQLRDLQNANLARAEEMFGGGMSVRDVGKKLKISKSAAERLKKKPGEKGNA